MSLIRRSRRSGGYDTLDVMKWICALMVVVIHCKPMKPYSNLLNVLTAEGICRIAVPFFFCTSSLLLCGKLSAHPSDEQARRRICRKAWLGNIKLYLTWSALYWIFFLPEWCSSGRLSWGHMLDQLRFLLIDTGSCYHFWYMVALLYALPLMPLLWKCSNGMLIVFVCLLWPFQCIRYAYRWIPGGDIFPWDSDWLDALMNTAFCAVPLLMVGILCFRYHRQYDAKRWAISMVALLIANLGELMALYFYAPHTGHFEFLLTTPLLVFCLINCLLTLNVSFADRRIPLALRQASVWIYCIHPMLIGAYGYVHSSMGVRRFIVVLALCLLSSMAYVCCKRSKLKIGKEVNLS